MIPSTDYILNGKGYGGVGAALQQHKFQVGALRPYVEPNGRTYVSVIENGQLVAKEINNAPTTLPYDSWKIIDTAVEEAARERRRAINDLRSRGLVRNIPNAMGKTFIQWQKMSRLTPATISMDPARTSEFDRPDFDVDSIPLPIIHKDFKFNLREIEESQNGGMPLNDTTARLAAEEVMDLAEQLLIGSVASYSYGGKAVYGYRNHPDRNVYALADPTDPGWTPDDTVNDILAMRQLLYDDRIIGPAMIYVSPGLDLHLDADYSATKGENTLRDRILAIRNVIGIETLDFLPDTEILIVDMNRRTVQELIGFDVQTFRWPEEGGFEMRFKVAAMLIPWVKSDQDGNSGIVHGTVA